MDFFKSNQHADLLSIKSLPLLPYDYVKLIVIAIICNYIATIARFYLCHLDNNNNRLPPTYPTLIPILGTLIPFLWDNEGFFRNVTSLRNKFTAARISILGYDIYLFQDREAIRRIWKASTLSSPQSISLYTFKYFFGVPEKTLQLYRSDDTGPFRKPYPGSNVPNERRVDYLSHHEFLRALTGPGLAPTVQRFRRALERRADELFLPTDWMQGPDFRAFFQNIGGAPLVESVFGPALLDLNPSFMQDLYAFDGDVPWLARGIPSILQPRPYRIRKRLWAQLTKWHEYANKGFSESSIYDDGDGDPFWGSAFIRNRHTMFSQLNDHSGEANVALDLGLAFGLVTNASPAALLAIWHIFQDISLLDRVRADLREEFGSHSVRNVDLKQLSNMPLLQAIYAETLRLYTKIYVVVSSPQTDVPLGRWKLPKGSVGLLNSSISHRDPEFWNTKDNLHPVDHFWADRFLTYPDDPTSGPINPAVRAATGRGNLRTATLSGSDKPIFSTDGLDDSWFPYGGGYSICPGRYLAKSAIIFTCALLVTEFDVEFLTDTIVPDKWRFGLGIVGPKNELPFRIRRRQFPAL